MKKKPNMINKRIKKKRYEKIKKMLNDEMHYFMDRGQSLPKFVSWISPLINNIALTKNVYIYIYLN